MSDREIYMQEALRLAEEAAACGDVPVGCVITDADGNIIGRGRNRREENRDATAHAEVEAIREAFANLCVHADYSEESSLIVNLYPHRIVFSNPGTMLISRQQFFQGGESVCRNMSLQQMFMMIGSAEKAGSGVDKILKGWETLNWKRPYPFEKAQPNKVELIMPLESLLDEKVLAELDNTFGDRLKHREQADIMALSIALTENVINNERLRDVLAMHPADITHLLQRLCKEEFLVSSGHGRGTVYTLKGTTLQANDSTLQADATTLQANTTALQANTTALQAGETTIQANETISIPERLPKEELYKIIMEYCSEWRTAEEIALHVHRSKQYIRGEILPGMEQMLERRFPLKEKHPGQKYKVKEQ